MKSKKELKKISEEIFSLEKEMQAGKNVKSNMDKIEIIMRGLSFDDILIIDQMVSTKLTKEKIFVIILV